MTVKSRIRVGCRGEKMCLGRVTTRGMCDKHYQRWLKHGDPSTVLAKRDRRTGPLTYAGMHLKVRRIKGSATEYVCPCGAQASQWSYDHQDPNEIVSLVQGYSLAWSRDLNRYRALCGPCHWREDHR